MQPNGDGVVVGGREGQHCDETGAEAAQPQRLGVGCRRCKASAAASCLVSNGGVPPGRDGPGFHIQMGKSRVVGRRNKIRVEEACGSRTGAISQNVWLRSSLAVVDFFFLSRQRVFARLDGLEFPPGNLGW